MTLHVTLERSEDGFVVAECPALPGCVSQGKDEDEAMDNIGEAITGWLSVEDRKAVEALPKDLKVRAISTVVTARPENSVANEDAESRRARLLEFLRSDLPVWRDEDHPELVELGTEGWVRAMRDEWEERMQRIHER